MQHAYSNRVEVQHIPYNRVPMRDWDPEVKRKLSLLGFVVVAIAIVVYFFCNHLLYENTSEFYIEHNIIAAVCTGVAAYLILCMMIIYQRRNGMLRFWERIMAPQRQQERPDQRHENIEMQENIVHEPDP
ncbi:hypothetical protein CDAR_19381 [Caerostris darwini]|uniref:Uncharacterized protein n=1 Tax=Caerostris darwini TaxID=1538125 RepID=A0AAV4WBT6_9ARAC|nr:hypothetical protein CDAR_19381 [Caerostris darwini]